eukprot:NODE_441_length_8548_cov_0.413185.p2 type:complete len:370 gc:universal NODE_441_length_8548_cov_0.413185:6087-4978(-)
MRYDRQIRIWQSSGQSKIESSRILCIGEGFLMMETLKNLILGGFGFIYIVESEWINEKHKQLQNFNPHVHFEIVDKSSLNFNNINLILSLNNLSDINIPSNIPIIESYTIGWYGYISISHSGYIVQKREKHFDLMLYAPFQSLLEYLKSFDISSIDDYEYSHVPYPVFLNRIKSFGKNRKELRQKLRSFIRPNVDMDNIQEAMDNVFYVYTRNEYTDVKLLFDSVLTDPQESAILNAISVFYRSNLRLPVSLDIPDIKSTTNGYLAFKKIYSDQFIQDCLEIQQICKLEYSIVEEWCKNIRDLKWVKPHLVNETSNVAFSDSFEIHSSGIELYSYLKQHLNYRKEFNKFPSSYKDLNCNGELNGYFVLM